MWFAAMMTCRGARHATGWRRTTGKRNHAAAVAAALVMALLAGCEASPATGPRDGGVTGLDASTGLTRWRPPDRPAMPELSGRTLDGGRLDVAAWRGQVVVVNTWGSWCGPCREETPVLARVWSETRRAGVRFVGIDTRDNDAAARAFVREFNIGYPSLVDEDGRLMLAFGPTIPVSAVPTTVVVDRKGRVAARIIGPVTYATLRGLIDDTLGETEAS
jgi:thiol-disulfide isomerase/thioredoxin